jgi:alkylated DNA repair dioxygenase AlkB
MTTGVWFEGCFMNLYENGTDALGWHADDDPKINHEKPIAVVSLGSWRSISLRSNDKTWHAQRILDPGSLLMMPAGSQQTHQHKIAKASDMARATPRISLTFRSLHP